MGRRSKSSSLDVYMNGELVGWWSVDSRQEHKFSYAESWLAGPTARPISLSLPLRPAQTYRGVLVADFFDNLLPDSQAIRRRIQARFQLPTAVPIELLGEIGRDCIGALQLLPAGMEPPDPRRIAGRSLSDSEMEERLAGLSESPVSPRFAEFRISLAGAQEKTAFLHYEGRWMEPLGATPSTHIFKLPIGKIPTGLDLSTSVENEWLCHRVLQEFGMPVASCSLLPLTHFKVLVVERFDRRLARDGNWIIRLPQEDMCQATGTPLALKYESDGGPGIQRLMRLLLGADDPELQRRRFFQAQVIFWLLCAIDGHAKNFSVCLEPAGRYRLAPLYDILSAYPVLGTGSLAAQNVKMAMAVCGRSRHYRWSRIERRHWLETARQCGLAEAERLLDELVELTPGVVARVAASLPPDFPSAISDPILQGLTDCAKRLI